MGRLSDRGEAVSAGGAQLAAADGDDTLNQPTGTDGSAATVQTGEVEAAGGADAPDSAALPGPADIPAAPVVETADADNGNTETR